MSHKSGHIIIDQLLTIMPSAGDRLAPFVEPLNAAMEEFGITSAQRQAAFLAQCAHESGEFRYMRELASGEQYEGRKDLGNTQPGDGRRFRGRGPIQITGRANYEDCGKALGLDLIAHPELLELPEHGCRASAWFWAVKGLNKFADSDSFGALTRAINGGFTHLDNRIRYWLRARAALEVS